MLEKVGATGAAIHVAAGGAVRHKHVCLGYRRVPYLLQVTCYKLQVTSYKCASGIAAYKREPDLALGNLIGSNIFNVFLAAGISASIIPLPVDVQALEFDFWWMTGIAMLVGLMMMHKGTIHRWKGALLLLIYLAYIGWIGGGVAAVASI